MTERNTADSLERTAKDFLAGLAVFALIMFASVASSSKPAPVLINPSAHINSFDTEVCDEIPVAGAARTPGSRTSFQDAKRVILAVVFAGILALNFGFYRHLRRAYASAQPGEQMASSVGGSGARTLLSD